MRVRVHLGAKKKKKKIFNFWRGWRQIPLLFIVMIESILKFRVGPVAQLVASMSGVVLGGVVEIVGSYIYH